MTPILSVKFFVTEAGSEPAREWLKDLSAQDRKTIGEDIKTVQFRTKLDNRIARVLFVIVNNTMILLHGFIKKDQKTPKPELDLAKQRLKTLRGKR